MKLNSARQAWHDCLYTAWDSQGHSSSSWVCWGPWSRPPSDSATLAMPLTR